MNELMNRGDFSKIQSQFTEISTNETFAKEVGFCLQAVNTSPQLKKCTKSSLLASVYQIASIGLSLNPVKKEAYLIPRWSRDNGMEAQLMPSYQGLIKLVTDTGSVKNVYCNLVYEGDEFDVELGTTQIVTHKPKFKTKDIQLVYAVAVLPDGNKQIEVMTIQDIEEIRERSDAYQAFKAGKMKTTVWVTDKGEMCRKTVLRRIVKYLPKSDKWEKVRNAIAQDEQEFIAPDSMLYKIEDLLLTSSKDEEEKKQLYVEVNQSLSIGRAKEILRELELSQVDPITSGQPYSQTQIKEKLS